MAANPRLGEIAFDVYGAEYIFKFGINEQVIIEGITKMLIQKWSESKKDGFGAQDLQLIFYAGLSKHHGVTKEEAGEIVDQIGGIRASELFMEAIELAKVKTNGTAESQRPMKATKERIGTLS